MVFTISRSARITILLVIDILFFFLELVVGYAVGSLALVADSFHMLNDVMSLVVALYAIKLTEKTETDSRYSYGWHRAEILSALINGVFLLALCFSIFLEALERFFNTIEISNPKLVVIVGSLGLASNIVGLFLFHDHGHSHDHTEHTHTPELSLPIPTSGDVTPTQKINVRSPSRERSRSRSESFSSLYGHPVATRASLVQTAQEMGAFARSPSPSNRHIRRSISRHRDSIMSNGSIVSQDAGDANSSTALGGESLTETTPLIHHGNQEDAHDSDSHPEPFSHGHGHSHAGSMNMRALVLHVFGDALGNIGVIATGLVIWLSHWNFKYYFDPIVSLVITVIIFSSALPLVRSASFILLQGVPSTVSLDDVRDSILNVEGVISLHELHIWQLSESKIIASVHVLASRNHEFMPVASKIREALHRHGIHSSTIQPEYLHSSNTATKSASETSCLILCPPDGCNPSDDACCPPPPITV